MSAPRRSLPAFPPRVVGPSASAADESWRFAAIVAGLFALLTAWRLVEHELWRDEAWLWLVVRESGSFTELFAALGRSGQGNLYPLLADLAHQLSDSWRALQALNLVITAAAAFLFARWAPLARPLRVLVLLGYFPFYEYAVFSRHYALGMLLLWIACAAAASRRPALGLGASLGLLCQTTVYGFVLAVAVGVGWLSDRWSRRDELPRIARGEAIAGGALALGGALAGLWQLRPLPGTSFAPGWHFGWEPAIAARVLRLPWRAFVPVPRFELHFWNSNLLDGFASLQPWLGWVTLVVAVAILRPRRASLVSFAVGGLGLAAFAYTKYVGEGRHAGHIWLLFLAALWLGGGLHETAGRSSWREWTVSAVVVCQVIAGGFASAMDLVHPFSNAARTATAVREAGLDRLPLLGYREPPAAPVALSLGQPLFSPARGLFTTHPDWGPEQRDLPLETVRCRARGLARRTGKDVGLVVNQGLPGWPEIEPVGEILGAILESEDYRLYRLRADRLAATQALAGCSAGE